MPAPLADEADRGRFGDDEDVRQPVKRSTLRWCSSTALNAQFALRPFILCRPQLFHIPTT
jgi:hypothetical protein